MPLEKTINKTLNNLRSFKSRLVSSGRKAIYAGILTVALTAGARLANVNAQNTSSLNSNTDYSWIDPINSENEFVSRPDLGYVVKTHENSNFGSLDSMLKSFGAIEIKSIGGAGHNNLSIISGDNQFDENKIQLLSTSNQVNYSAPLFSVNGETVAIIPEIVTKVKDGTSREQLELICRDNNLSINKKMDHTVNEYLIDVEGDNAYAVFDGVNQLNQTPEIEWASLNLAFQPKSCGRVNDPIFPEQWYLDIINAQKAWETTTGDPNVVVAVLDTGVDYNHEDLFPNIWVNPNIVEDRIPDGIIDVYDLDLNHSGSIENNELNMYGETNGVIGYDFLDDDNKPNPIPDHPHDAHGTACAGTIAARGNNSKGVAGVAYNCKIMPIRIKSSNAESTFADIATGIRWAAINGADILNNSWTSLGSPILHSAIKDVTVREGIGRKGKGCIVLAGSGNQESYFGGILEVGITPPASYPEVIAVGATDYNDRVWGYSDYGITLEIMAPSDTDKFINENFWTTDISGSSGYNNNNPTISPNYTQRFGGTSGACAIAAGTSALVLSVNPNLTGLEARSILSHSARDLIVPGWDELSGNGRIDAYAAVNMALNPPEPIIYVSTTPNSMENGSIEYPFSNIQKAINNAIQGDTVIVLPGIHTGNGNRDIKFHRKAITVRSKDGPESCIIDCQNSGRGFIFHRREEANSILEGLTITNGTADYGAGIRCSNFSNPTIRKCVFTHNSAETTGGGIAIRQSDPLIVNCIFNANYAGIDGGGIENWYSDAKIINCTLSGNSAGENGGGIVNKIDSNTQITNSIFWNNSPDEVHEEKRVHTPYHPDPDASEIIVDEELKIKITYSNIQGGWPGPGNININPQFADPENGDYHLKSPAGRWDPNLQTWVFDDVTSRCIDAGDPNSSLEGELLSIPDHPETRVHNNRINMGAYGGTADASFAIYNWSLIEDLNNDGISNFIDFAIKTKQWKNLKNSDSANPDYVLDYRDFFSFKDWSKRTD